MGLGVWFIRSPNRKVHIAVKMSYEPRIYDVSFTRYDYFAKIAIFSQKWLKKPNSKMGLRLYLVQILKGRCMQKFMLLT